MLVIVANQHDPTARWLASRWQAQDALVLMPNDLSSPGWRYYGGAGKSRAIIGGREVSSEDIQGVLTRMPAVFEWELGHIVPADRQYVAAEMNAFLVAWLASLSCPMLNRPHASSISGPGWNHEQWVALAAQLGIPVRPVHRSTLLASGQPATEPTCKLIVVGDRCFGAAASQLTDSARSLAAAAGTALLGVQFNGPDADAKLLTASLWPDVGSPEIADAMLRWLLRSEC
jgi:hypothetical protein